MNQSDSTPPPLTGYEVLVCVCGGIAAFKVAGLVSALAKREAGVTVAMTRNARRFVGPITFEALSGRPVATSMWRPRPGEIAHLSPTERADLVVVAPATANIIGKMAGGIADDLVSSMLIGAAAPVMVAPAMNSRMWQHPATQRNIQTLQQDGCLLVGPENGWQACRAAGTGRMSEPDEILDAISNQLLTNPPKSPQQ